MDTLLRCELVETARQLIRHNDETLSRQLEEFQEALSEILFSQMGYLEIDRKLRESAFIINERLMSKKKPEELVYFRQAYESILVSISHNDKRLTYPELFSPMAPPPASPLRWNGNKTDLYELVVALHECGVISYNGGEEIPFSQLVTHLCRFFNIRAGDPRDIKRNVLSRKIRLTNFIDRLKSALENNDY